MPNPAPKNPWILLALFALQAAPLAAASIALEIGHVRPSSVEGEPAFWVTLVNRGRDDFFPRPLALDVTCELPTPERDGTAVREPVQVRRLAPTGRYDALVPVMPLEYWRPGYTGLAECELTLVDPTTEAELHRVEWRGRYPESPVPETPLFDPEALPEHIDPRIPPDLATRLRQARRDGTAEATPSSAASGRRSTR